MNEIKFKQAITDNQTGEIRWHHWGFLHTDTAGCAVFINPLAAVEWDDRPSYQFTGLKDKNGVEIYEGDKVNWEWDEIIDGGEQVKTHRKENNEVFWCDEMAQFALSDPKEHIGHWAFGNEDARFEVIGNVHDEEKP